jgi:hypothetical protein
MTYMNPIAALLTSTGLVLLLFVGIGLQSIVAVVAGGVILWAGVILGSTYCNWLGGPPETAGGGGG